MRKLDRKGFTLIELLAVITILGILMIVAIPAVSRTIENSRRNTFLSTAKQYANAVKTAFAADEVKCSKNLGTAAAPSLKTISATTLTKGQAFWIPIQTDSTKPDVPGKYAYDNAKELVNQGGVSSWGNANVQGWVVGVVDQKINAADNKLRQEIKYYIELIDENGRGIAFPIDSATVQTETTGDKNALRESDELERSDVAVSNLNDSGSAKGATNNNVTPALDNLSTGHKAKITGAPTPADNFLCHLG